MKLEDLRTEIDDVDRRIIELISKRFELTEIVGELKAKEQLDALSPNREFEQFKRFEALSSDLKLSYVMIEKIFLCIRDQVISNHESIKVKYCGK